MMTAKFLTGMALTKQIREVMAGKNPRMCVAFLGPNWATELFEGSIPDDLKLICDLQMKITPRAALFAGGVPHNKKFRHLLDTEMHAKLYISEVGAIVCSANASAKALSSKTRIEDGVWIAPKTSAYSEITNEFKRRYKKAKQIDKAALDAAPERTQEPGGALELPEGLSLVEALRQNPGAFHGIRFICTSQNVQKDIQDAADEILDNELEDGSEPDKKGSRHYFSGWHETESEWPAVFISVHRGRLGRIYLSKQRHNHFLPQVEGTSDTEDVFVSKKLNWRAKGAAFCDLPPFASLAECERELGSMFPTEDAFSTVEGKILTGIQLAKKLFQDR